MDGHTLAVSGGSDGVATLLEGEGHDVVAVDPRRAADLPFDDSSFDTVVLEGFLAEWASRERPIAEARRVLRPRGRLLIAVPYARRDRDDSGGDGDGEAGNANGSNADAGSAASDGERQGVSLGDLLGDLDKLSVKEMAAGDGELCLLAERAGEKSRAAVWRRALGVAEGQLSEREKAVAGLTASVASLQDRCRREERALDDARENVVCLETALAAATHERDRKEEMARLSGEGVSELENRVEQLRHSRDIERTEAERELERHAAEAENRLAQAQSDLRLQLDEVREQLAAREKHLDNAKAGIESRDRRLEVAGEQLNARNAELEARTAELAELNGQLTTQQSHVAVAKARLELREEELGRSRDEAEAAKHELSAVQESLRELERANALLERELADRASELDQAEARLADREREVDAASTLLEAQGAELARARDEKRTAQLELDETRGRLEKNQQHLKTAQIGVESRDRRLQAAERNLQARNAELASRGAELERLRATTLQRERNLQLIDARLEKAQQRAELFRSSLLELRGARAYRLMRVLWRLRHPFRRAPRGAKTGSVSMDDDAESSPASGPATQAPPPSVPASSAPAVAKRRIDVPSQRVREPGSPLRVASILDEMSEACFAPECELVPLSLARWAEELDDQQADLLLVESAWNGNGGEWQYYIAQYPRKDLVGLPMLRALVGGCRERGIPTAFWNKEDPVHFDRFSEAASLFDHVFTTDARCIERYEALAGDTRTVTALPFAAQPRIHNPVAAVPQRSNSPCFAGAWYRDRHAERRQSLEALLDAARPYGLVIYDRNFGEVDKAFGFPERFAPHVLGKLPYERILDVYKSHKVFLNANSVVDSPTMCSRRVFELAACDTAILSTPGAALRALLGEGMIEEAAEEGTADEALERLLTDEEERRRHTRAARRKVFAEHTYAERLAKIAETAGLDASSLRREPFALPGGASTLSTNGSGVGVPSANGAPNGHPWVLHLLPGVTLSEPAIADFRAAATFAEADVIGAGVGNGGPAPEHGRANELDPRALLLRRELISSGNNLTGSAEQICAQLRRWGDDGIRLYAADSDLVGSSAPQLHLG